MSSSVDSPSGAASSSSWASWSEKPRPTSPSRASKSRIVSPRDRDGGPVGHVGHLLAQLDDDPLGRSLADARDRLEARGVARRDRRDQLAGRPAGEDGERDLGPHGLHAEQHQEEVALLLRVESVERELVVAHDEMRVQRGRLARGGNVLERLGRDGEAVADAAAVDHDVVGTADGDVAADERDHPVIAIATGAWLRSQMATARASAAWSGRGGSGSASSAATILCTWSLSARPEPQTAPLTCWGV